MSGTLRAEGPREAGTITLVSADDGVNLYYGGDSLVVKARSGSTNISLAVPGLRVRKRWFPTDEPSGEGMIIAVEQTGHVYGPTCHVLWSQQPRSFGVDWPSPQGFKREYQGQFIDETDSVLPDELPPDAIWDDD